MCIRALLCHSAASSNQLIQLGVLQPYCMNIVNSLSHTMPRELVSTGFCSLAPPCPCALRATDECLRTGARLTVRQAMYLLLIQKRDHRERDTLFNINLRMLAAVILPGNLLPPSLYLMQKVAKVQLVQPPAPVSYHLRNDHHSWPHLAQGGWQAHRSDICAECAAPRFIVSTSNGAACLRPADVIYLIHPAASWSQPAS